MLLRLIVVVHSALRTYVACVVVTIFFRIMEIVHRCLSSFFFIFSSFSCLFLPIRLHKFKYRQTKYVRPPIFGARITKTIKTNAADELKSVFAIESSWKHFSDHFCQFFYLQKFFCFYFRFKVFEVRAQWKCWWVFIGGKLLCMETWKYFVFTVDFIAG